jgi:type II secretory pathway pseudopilin PulG
MKRHPFNLIELMLALGVIVIGLVSVLALFPIGANANRDAAAGNYSSQSAEQTLSLIARHITESFANWDTFVADLDGNTATPTLLVTCSGPAAMETYMATWDGFDVKDYVNPSTFNLGTPDTIFQDDTTRYDQGFLIKSRHTNSDGEFVNDFEAMAFIWQENLDVKGNPIPLKYGTCLNMEISWPAQLPYARRQKATYRLEVFNPHMTN